MDNEDQQGGIEFDLFSREFKANPFPTFERMRDKAPIFAQSAPDGSTIWYITRYADVLAVLRDNENFCKDPRNTGVPPVSGSAITIERPLAGGCDQTDFHVECSIDVVIVMLTVTIINHARYFETTTR
mgnify:CR=1 FL=1